MGGARVGAAALPVKLMLLTSRSVSAEPGPRPSRVTAWGGHFHFTLSLSAFKVIPPPMTLQPATLINPFASKRSTLNCARSCCTEMKQNGGMFPGDNFGIGLPKIAQLSGTLGFHLCRSSARARKFLLPSSEDVIKCPPSCLQRSSYPFTRLFVLVVG